MRFLALFILSFFILEVNGAEIQFKKYDVISLKNSKKNQVQPMVVIISNTKNDGSTDTVQILNNSTEDYFIVAPLILKTGDTEKSDNTVQVTFKQKTYIIDLKRARSISKSKFDKTIFSLSISESKKIKEIINPKK